MNNIGFIGLGTMGVPMAQNLINAGYHLTLYNRSRAKAEKVVGDNVKISVSPSDLLESCEIIILMVADDAAIQEIFNSEDGLFQRGIKDKIFLNMSTVSPAISKEIAARAEQYGSSYIDAPVSGSLKQAKEGTLVIMVGGSVKVFQEVKPILEILGKLALRVGDVGSGNIAKLAINSLLSLYALGLAETINFSQSKGLETSTLLTLINSSALGNVFTGIKGQAILENNYHPVFALKHISKDLRLAKQEGLDSPLARVAYCQFKDAEDKVGEEDIIAVIKSL